MIRIRMNLVFLAASAGFFGATPAFALGGAAAGFSKEVTIACAESAWYNPFPCVGFLIFDPPGVISSIGFNVNYDNSIYQILPAQSGFLCDFSDGGYCPATNPNSVTFDPGFSVGSPRAGTNYSFVVTPSTISLLYDMSANPAPNTGDRNAFAIAFTTSSRLNFEFHTQQGLGNLQTVSVSCQLVGGGTCGSDSPAWGITGTSVPEPAAWAMLIVGFGMIGNTMRRRRRQMAQVLA
jgi:hypothetical protein